MSILQRMFIIRQLIVEYIQRVHNLFWIPAAGHVWLESEPLGENLLTVIGSLSYVWRAGRISYLEACFAREFLIEDVDRDELVFIFLVLSLFVIVYVSALADRLSARFFGETYELSWRRISFPRLITRDILSTSGEPVSSKLACPPACCVCICKRAGRDRGLFRGYARRAVAGEALLSRQGLRFVELLACLSGIQSWKFVDVVIERTTNSI